MRSSYTRRATAPDGTEVVLRASRKQDADVTGEFTWWLPWPVFVAGEVLRELRMRDKYEGRWIVRVRPRWGFEKGQVLGEFPRAEALDLVDARADEITHGGPR